MQNKRIISNYLFCDNLAEESFYGNSLLSDVKENHYLQV